MTSARIVAVVICVVLLSFGYGMWASRSVGAAAIDFESSADEALGSFTVDEPERGRDSDDLRIDRYGNQVESAIGEYRVDPRGEMYEMHSPETALPRLATPVG